MKRKTIYKIIHEKQKQKQKTKQNTKKKKRVYLSLMIISMFFVSKRCTYRWFRTRRMRYEEQQQVTSSGHLVPFLVYFLLSGRWGGNHIIQPFILLFWGFTIVYVLLLCLYLDHLCVWKNYSHTKAVLPHMYSSGLTVKFLLLNRGICQHILYLPCIDDWWGLCRLV
jgi:Flp pilus assembly protein TadB